MILHGPRTNNGARICRDPGSNRGPADLHSDALPTEVSRHLHGHAPDYPFVLIIEFTWHESWAMPRPLCTCKIVRVGKVVNLALRLELHSLHGTTISVTTLISSQNFAWPNRFTPKRKPRHVNSFPYTTIISADACRVMSWCRRVLCRRLPKGMLSGAIIPTGAGCRAGADGCSTDGCRKACIL